MSYKLIVFDLDDTLLNKDHQLTKKTIENIKKLKNIGKKVTIATGRMFVSALPYAKELEIDLPLISYNGAYVCDPLSHEVIYHQTIAEDLVQDIIIEAENNELHLNLYYGDDFYIKERNEGVEIYEDIAGVKGNAIGKLSENYRGEATKILVIEKDQQKKYRYLNYFKENYGDRLEITESKEYFIEFTAKNVSKKEALEKLAKSLNIAQKNVVAVGNGFNDLTMIEWASLGIAVDNAPQPVKDKADLIAGHHDSEGVAEILEEIFKI
ncbi:MAG: Cof-type HAD-IIB family hydrolase [Bacillota bacterium]